ncbi:MAG: hypothetical protein HY905_21765 [Deltaproteobacteria bacterium]|nr:hypothetical protein [Deltaproteobacteria bacterium]
MGYQDGHWLRIDRAGTVLHKAESCAVCGCDDCPGCPVCGAPCMDATELPSGRSVEYLWNGMEYPLQACPVEPSTVCEEPAICGPVEPYTALICWGTRETGTPCNETVENLECDNVPFTVPDPDGVVEYTIDRGG